MTVTESNDAMFSIVRLIRTNWKQPEDWWTVISQTIAEYIPPEKTMTRNEILAYIRRHLDPYGPPPHRGPLTADMPLW